MIPLPFLYLAQLAIFPSLQVWGKLAKFLLKTAAQVCKYTSLFNYYRKEILWKGGTASQVCVAAPCSRFVEVCAFHHCPVSSLCVSVSPIKMDFTKVYEVLVGMDPTFPG